MSLKDYKLKDLCLKEDESQVGEKRYYYCTLSKNHVGQHMAVLRNGTVLRKWEEKNEI